MNWTRQQLKSNAKLMVKKNWVLCVVISLVMTMIGGSQGIHFNANYNFSSDFDNLQHGMDQAASQLGGEWVHWIQMFFPFLAGAMILVIILAIAADIFLGNPLRVGGSRFYLHNIHSKGEFGDLGFAFQYQYGNVVKVMFFRDLYIWLWSLLFIIPGVIKGLQYRMVPYLLADNPELTTDEALALSRKMMDGEKMNAFVLDLSFIGWDILSSLTLGILGFLWVNPYQDATNAELYTALSARGTNNYYTES